MKKQVIALFALIVGLSPLANAYRDLETGTFLTRDPIGYADGPNVYCYVHCNPISNFDAFGLETEDESEKAARDWYANNPDGERSFDDWYSEKKDWWYDRRAGEGYTIYNNDLDTIIKEGDHEARKDLFSGSAETARKETLQMLCYERNWRLNEANGQTDEWQKNGGSGRPRTANDLLDEAWGYDRLATQFRPGGNVAGYLSDPINGAQTAYAVYSFYGMAKFGFSAVRLMATSGDDAFRVLGTSIDDFAMQGSCFLSGTLILTENGEIPIQDVKVGERVWSFDLLQGEWLLNQVESPLVHAYTGNVVTVCIADQQIMSTDNHPFWVVKGSNFRGRPLPADVPASELMSIDQGRWVEAKDLLAGDKLLLRSGETSSIESVDSQYQVAEVFNLTIEGLHNYAVSSAGVLVHNKAKSFGGFKNLKDPRLKSAGIDAHAAKANIVGKPNVSKFNIAVDKSGSVVLTPVRKGGSPVPTGMTLDDLKAAYPLKR